MASDYNKQDKIAYNKGYWDGRYEDSHNNEYDEEEEYSQWMKYEDGFREGTDHRRDELSYS